MGKVDFAKGILGVFARVAGIGGKSLRVARAAPGAVVGATTTGLAVDGIFNGFGATLGLLSSATGLSPVVLGTIATVAAVSLLSYMLTGNSGLTKLSLGLGAAWSIAEYMSGGKALDSVIGLFTGPTAEAK